MNGRFPPALPLPQPDEGSSGALCLVASDESEPARRKKELEIRELQEANRSLLQRVSSSRTTPPFRALGGSASASNAWPPALPLPPAAKGKAAVAPAEGKAAAVPVSPERPNATSLQGLLGMVEKTALLQNEVVELQQSAEERGRELEAQCARAERSREELVRSEAKAKELKEENTVLRNVRGLVEQLQSSGDGASYKVLRNYMDSDLAAMRAERRDAEALLQEEVRRWEDAAERYQAECREVMLQQEAAAGRLETLREEQKAFRMAAEGAALCADEAVEQRMLRAKSQVESAEAAVDQLRQQVEIEKQEKAKAMNHWQRFESVATDQQLQSQDLAVKLQQAEDRGEDLRQRFSRLEMRFEAQENRVFSEQRLMEEEVGAQEASALEERKKLKREATRKVAEYQAMSSEVQSEAEESAARSKEAERGLQLKLSNLRQERQRVETKLRAQLQSVQAELQLEQENKQESQEVLARWSDMMQEMSAVKRDGATAEKEVATVRHQHMQVASKLQKKNELLQEELRIFREEAKRAVQSELSEERDRCFEETLQKLSTVEKRHSQQIAQLYEDQETELGFISDQGQFAARKLELQVESLESAAAAQSLLLEGESAQVESLTSMQDELRGELTEARADAEGALEEHEALLLVLQREHEAADVQFQQLLLQAEERQRKLGRLQHSDNALLQDIDEETLSSHPALSARSGVTTRCSTVISRPLPSQNPLLLPAQYDLPMCSPGSSVYGSSTARGGALLEGDGIDGVLRSLQHERELRRAQRLGDEFAKALAAVEDERKAPTLLERSRQEDSKRALDTCRCLFRELLVYYEQALQVKADDTMRLMALREKEATLRSELKHSNVRSASMRRMEMHGDEHETAIARLETSLERAQLRSDEETVARDKLHLELKEVSLHLRQKMNLVSSSEEGEEVARALAQDLREVRMQLSEEQQRVGAAARAAEESASQKWMADKETLHKTHSDEKALLIAEIQQFQKERFVMDESIRRSQAQLPRLESELADAESALSSFKEEHLHRGRRLHALEMSEQECAAREGAEAQVAEQLELKTSALTHAREQLHATREERMKEKHRHEKQIERLRARVEALERHELALEKHAELTEKHETRHMEDYVQRFENCRREARQMSVKLQEAHLEEEGRARDLEHVHQHLKDTTAELSCAESKCEKLMTEWDSAVSSEQALCMQHQSLEDVLANQNEMLQSAESWGKELTKRLQTMESHAASHQDLQGDDELQAEQSGQLNQLHMTIKSECQQMLPFLPADDAEELMELMRSGPEMSATIVMQTLRAVGRTTAGLMRERTADLRQQQIQPVRTTGTLGIEAPAVSAGAGPDLSAKVASLQKELIKLREQNQELLHEKRLLQEQQPAKPAADPSASAENVYIRHQLKSAQQLKVKAETQCEQLKADLHKRTSTLQAEVDRLQASYFEERRHREADEAQAQKRCQALERKVRATEAKLNDHAEAHRQLMVEKENLEQQLGVAAHQLESLLIAEESKDGDLQRDLSLLSKQFEQLHQKHRAQLARAAETGKFLQQEESCRSRLEEEFNEESRRALVLHQEECAKQTDLLAVRSELAASSREVTQLRSWQQQEALTAQELEDQLQQLRDQLQQARENNPRAREAVRHLKEKEEELGGLRSELESAEAAWQRLHSEFRAQAAELKVAAECSAEPSPASRRQTRGYERSSPALGDGEQVRVRTAEDGDEEGPPSASKRAPTEQGPSLDAMLTVFDSHEMGLLTQKTSSEKRPAAEQGGPEEAIVPAKRTAENVNQDSPHGEHNLRQHQKAFDDLPVQGPPVAADVDLSAVGRKVVRGYPDSPPGRHQTGDGGAASSSSTLFAKTHRAFQEAEALCEQQRFAEAVPLFQQVLQAIDHDQELNAPAAFVAEVWAHMGVAVQSLDRVPEAIKCYKKALTNDATLHVCFANLATLHGYLRDVPSAVEYIRQALVLDPQNETYIQIKCQLDEARSRGSRSQQPDPGAASEDANPEERKKDDSDDNS